LGGATTSLLSGRTKGIIGKGLRIWMSLSLNNTEPSECQISRLLYDISTGLQQASVYSEGGREGK